MVKIGLNNLPILSWLTISWLAIPILSWLTEYQINTSLSKTFYLTIHAQVKPSKPDGGFNSFLKTGVCSFASKCFTVFFGRRRKKISSSLEKKCFPSQSWSFKNRQKNFFSQSHNFCWLFGFEPRFRNHRHFPGLGDLLDSFIFSGVEEFLANISSLKNLLQDKKPFILIQNLPPRGQSSHRATQRPVTQQEARLQKIENVKESDIKFKLL